MRRLPSKTAKAQSLLSQGDAFRSQLIAWYDRHARDLPWRSQPSLYKTVVSEFMLQQTQVKTVLPYFAAWLERFPDFAALAKADEAAVLKHWEGLGYYTRARNLHKLAKQLVALETVPEDAASWLAFPGVGPYAAAAICSIAFEDPSAVVDGNVVRILARLTGDRQAYATSTDAAKTYAAVAQTLINPKRPGDHNQAMMELGATVCQKRNPQCLLCPVADLCTGRTSGDLESIPRLAKLQYESQTIDRAWIAGPKGVLLRLIPATDRRMNGLHEIPTLAEARAKPTGDPIFTGKRSITKYRIEERFFQAALPKGPLPPDCSWIARDNLAQLALSGPHRKWLGKLLEQ